MEKGSHKRENHKDRPLLFSMKPETKKAFKRLRNKRERRDSKGPARVAGFLLAVAIPAPIHYYCEISERVAWDSAYGISVVLTADDCIYRYDTRDGWCICDI